VNAGVKEGYTPKIVLPLLADLACKRLQTDIDLLLSVGLP